MCLRCLNVNPTSFSTGDACWKQIIGSSTHLPPLSFLEGRGQSAVVCESFPLWSSQATTCELCPGRSCRKRAKCWSQVLWQWAFLGEKLPGREQEARQTVLLRVCLTSGTLPPQHYDQGKIPRQRQLANQEEGSAPSGQPECWPACYKKGTLAAVLCHGWEFMAEESLRAKLSKGFREGRLMVRPELWYHGAEGGDTKTGLGYGCLNVLD